MPVIIATIDAAKDFDHLDIDGLSSKSYRFTWDTKLGRYTYATSSQEDVDDLMNTQHSVRGWMFAFTVIVPDAEPVTPPPSVSPKTYAKHSPDDIAELAKGSGIKLTGQESPDLIRRLLDAYFLGEGKKVSKK